MRETNLGQLEITWPSALLILDTGIVPNLSHEIILYRLSMGIAGYDHLRHKSPPAKSIDIGFYLLHNSSSKLDISRQISLFSHGNQAKKLKFCYRKWIYSAIYIILEKSLTHNFSKKYLRNSHKTDRTILTQ